MDKSKVIAAYKRGFITVRECGQILGVEEMQLERLLQLEERKSTFLHQASGSAANKLRTQRGAPFILLRVWMALFISVYIQCF